MRDITIAGGKAIDAGDAESGRAFEALYKERQNNLQLKDVQTHSRLE
jgi:hypothetical protein